MDHSKFRKKAEVLLAGANIRINGNRPWDLQIHNAHFFERVLAEGSLGLGESYMEGWWDCDQLDEFFHRILRAGLDRKVQSWKNYLKIVQAILFNLQKPSRAFQIGEHHYDRGNRLYEFMLDELMTYSCAYWKEAADLDEAQRQKINLVASKLKLEPGMRVLDIGCGWGGAANYLARNYDVRVTGVTVSREQARYGRELNQGLPVEIRLQDYREVDGNYDRIYSIGMFEHVGYKNYRDFMQVASRNLKDNGYFVLHCIGSNVSVYKTDPWIQKYIFPNSMIPSARQITRASEKLFMIEDWQNFGPDYDKTLMAWYRNFRQCWTDIKEQYSSEFYRMWVYYLLASAGAFRARRNQLWQVVFSKGSNGRYDAPR